MRFALAYVNESDGLHKHVMRYPQLFATKAIERKLDAGVKKGIIWHTQGSGKTALAYYNTRFLTDYFQRKGVIPKFYFIVDRLDLATQAQREFSGRGLVVHTIDSRDAFATAFARKKLIEIPAAGHSFEEEHAQVIEAVEQWLTACFAANRLVRSGIRGPQRSSTARISRWRLAVGR